jgi:hypothetical protein
VPVPVPMPVGFVWISAILRKCWGIRKMAIPFALLGSWRLATFPAIGNRGYTNEARLRGLRVERDSQNMRGFFQGKTRKEGDKGSHKAPLPVDGEGLGVG